MSATEGFKMTRKRLKLIRFAAASAVNDSEYAGDEPGVYQDAIELCDALQAAWDQIEAARKAVSVSSYDVTRMARKESDDVDYHAAFSYGAMTFLEPLWEIIGVEGEKP